VIETAKATLLNALDQLEQAERDLGGPAERVDLVVVYSMGRSEDPDAAWHEVGGWAGTAGPKWLHAAMLRRAAAAQDEAALAVDDVDDDEDE
jgi:hypothetical protein